jgi:hypothetical protein
MDNGVKLDSKAGKKGMGDDDGAGDRDSDGDRLSFRSWSFSGWGISPGEAAVTIFPPSLVSLGDECK